MGPLTEVDELYSVSDLHLGGAPGFQIFNQGARLAALIDHLRARPKDRRLALVLNGDIVDFLAEPDAGYLKPDQAVAMIERIMADPAFAPVWQALGRFARTPNRLLVMCLGNHDVELALPATQARILRELCEKDRAARERVVFAMDGAGFSCAVGRSRVFCSHGNEVDPWNIVDYAQLDRVAAAQRAGEPPPAWDPNAGTQLVIDVMNGVKRKYPFVDLLKPETKVVPPLILSLDPGAVSSLRHFGSILFRKLRGTVRTGFLGAPDQNGQDGQDGQQGAEREAAFVREVLLGAQARQKGGDTAVEQVLAQMESDYRAGLRPLQVLDADDQERMLGVGDYILARLRGRSHVHGLREAIRDWLKDDRTFEVDTRDETAERLDQTVDPSFDFVLAGHTHLARALPRQRGRGFYYNSGTWIRLIRLPRETLESDEAFAPAYAAISANTMQAIDDARGVVLQRATVVRVSAEAGAVAGELLEARLDTDGRVTLESDPRTRFVRS